jgi:metal-responsive CopG/Arc/MetJ family transcriptional regulator
MARKQEARDPESVGVSVRLPATLLAEIDSLAVEERRTRGNLMRLLLEDALKSRQKK